MLRSQFIIFCCLVSMLACGGCSGGRSDADIKKITGGDLKKVTPASGTVKVDGNGMDGVVIYLHKKDVEDPLQWVTSGKDGKYCWTTYRPCDGLVAGEYTITFKHIPNVKLNGKGKDLFEGRYADPAKSEFKLTMEDGKPQTSLNYELQSK